MIYHIFTTRKNPRTSPKRACTGVQFKDQSSQLGNRIRRMQEIPLPTDKNELLICADS